MAVTEFTKFHIDEFKNYLINEERAGATVEKYVRDVETFLACLPGRIEITKERVLAYKKQLAEKYKSTSANSMLVALNQFFTFWHRDDLKVRLFKVQRTSFRENNRELTLAEYRQLVYAAKARKNERLSMMIQTICSTGIRVSEHRFITVEALKRGSIRISNKGKERVIFLTKKLNRVLGLYCRKKGITSGPIFVTKTGKPMNRCNIWAQMKALCADAGIDPQKVFPHNLRHLFALTYYRLEKDIVRLADILGHASIETTRIYTTTTAEECMRTLSRLNLLI